MLKQTSIYDLLKILEVKSYFDLTPNEKNKVKEFLEKDIEAWSFIAHPRVLEIILQAKNIRRYIFVIETIRADIYFSIRDFLSECKVNVNTYYTGGNADFICDAYLDETAYDEFFNSLKQKITKLTENIEAHPESLITVFKVNKSLILGGKNLFSNNRPDEDFMEKIAENPYEFELVLRDYMSEDAKQHFGDLHMVRKYLQKLRRKKVLLGYKVVYDYCRGIDKQYVPLGNANRQIETILSSKDKALKSEFTKPISELLAVVPVHFDDAQDRDVTHIAINEYKVPTDRQAWRNLFYRHDKNGGVNLFSYPLEGTLNESPFVLSDLPEVMIKAKPYLADDLHLGSISHLSIKQNIEVGLPADSLLFQGLTLGDPNSGKTTTDIALVDAVLDRVSTVIIIDDSGSIKGKTGLIKDKYINDNTFIPLKQGITLKNAKNEFEAILTQKGLRVIECKPSDYPTLFKAAVQCIQDLPDISRDGGMRTIQRFILLEEIHDALSGDNRETLIDDFSNCLTKASRKGCCIWASTQMPSPLVHNGSSKILELLQNKIMHKISSREEANILLESLTYLSDDDKEYILRNVSDPLPHSALVIGSVIKGGNQCSPLSPIMIKVDQPSNK